MRPRVARARSSISSALICLIALQGAPLLAAQDERPNILWIYVEDQSPYFGCYGNELNAGLTPHVDGRAERGVMFERCYVPAPVCSPCRSALITGAMQTSLGVHEHRSSRKEGGAITLPEGVQPLPELLREEGWSTFNLGKDDYNFTYTRSDLYSHGLGGKGGYLNKLRSIISDETARPFFGQVQLRGGKHCGALKNGKLEVSPATDPADVEVPPYYPDHELIRAAFATHHDSARVTDREVGQLLASLEEAGIADSTVVVFFTDHGMNESLRHKQFCYEGGVHVPLVVHVPEAFRPDGYRPGTGRHDLVSGLDVTATTAWLAGLELPAWYEGQSLFGPGFSPREWVVSARDRCDYTIERIRTVRTEGHRYIRNFLTDRPWMQPQYRDTWPLVGMLRAAISRGELADLPGGFFTEKRPAEELYDLEADPHQVVNLALSEENAELLAHHRELLELWIAQTGDRGELPESEAGLAAVHARWKKRCVNPEYAQVREHEHPAGPQLANGIKIGEVGSESALIWTRTTSAAERNAAGFEFDPDIKPADPALPPGSTVDDAVDAVPGSAGQVRVVWWDTQQPRRLQVTPWVATTREQDYTAQLQVDGLRPGGSYEVRVEARATAWSQPSATVLGSFVAPDASSSEPVRFAVVTGQGFHRRDDKARGHRIYEHMRSLDPHFFVHTGDIIYYDKPGPWATTVELARFKWNRMYALPLQRDFHAVTASYFLKDDHDTLKNDCWPGQSYHELTWERGLELFAEQLPAPRRPYRRERWSEDLEVWLLEGREYRSENRAPDGPDKTILGAAQLAWLGETLHASTAPVKIVISATPIVGPDRSSKNDNHANKGFSTEGRALRSLLADGGATVICGDRHWQYVSVDPETGLVEFSCGPTSDAHAGGFSNKPRPEHTYLRVKGGFLSVTVDRSEGTPAATFRHHDVEGTVRNAVVLPRAAR